MKPNTIDPDLQTREQPTERSFWFTAEEDDIRDLGHTAFGVASVIANRANLRPGPHPHGLALGEALLGYAGHWNMTGHEFRGARMRLERRGYASFRETERGWVGRLNDGRLYRIFPDSHYDDEGNLLNSEHTTDVGLGDYLDAGGRA
jgi:hypothetical protein